MSEMVSPIAETSPGTGAWLLDLGLSLMASVGELELKHLVPSPEWFDVPGAPHHCRKIFLWEDRLVPVIDLKGWLTKKSAYPRNALVGVFAYIHHRDSTVRYGSLRLEKIPGRIVIDDDTQACDLPEDGLDWAAVSHSCFRPTEGAPVPVLDLPLIFSNALYAPALSANDPAVQERNLI